MPDENHPLDPTDPNLLTEVDGAAAFRMGQELTQVDPTGWNPPKPEELDPLFADYQVTDLLGRGGMGAVYKAVQTKLKRTVAIKLLPPEMAQVDPTFKERFQREAEAMAAMDHPNIVTVFDFGITSMGHSYFVMEFVDGMDFHQLIHTGQLDPAGALNAVSQICDALEYAHEQGYVHRDIKPANIFINQKGILKVGDFGLAKIAGSAQTEAGAGLPTLTIAGSAMGTPFYSAPEQLDGGNVDHRADIYSLGVMFYEMLTREIPRGKVSPPSEKMENVDKRLDHVVFRAMESEPAARYPNVSEMRTEVDAVRTGAANSTAQSGDSAEVIGQEGLRSKATQGFLFITTALLVAASLFGTWWLMVKKPGSTESAETDKTLPKSEATVIRPGELIIIPTEDHSESIGLPDVPPSFNDVVYVSASTNISGEIPRLGVNFVRSDGSAWRILVGRQPELRHPSGVWKTSFGDGAGILILEDGNVVPFGSPMQTPFREDIVEVFQKGIKDLVRANRQLLALDLDGRMHWLTNIDAENSRSVFGIPSESGFQRVSIGRNHGIAIDSQGRLVVWGDGTGANLPDQIAGLLIKSIGVAEGSSWAIDQYGRIHAWGKGLDWKRSGNVRGILEQVHDSEEIFAFHQNQMVGIRRTGNRWLVFNQPEDSGDWIPRPDIAEQLQDCHFLAWTNGYVVGIREPGSSKPKVGAPAEEPPAGEPKSPFPLIHPYEPGRPVVASLEIEGEDWLPEFPDWLDDVVHACIRSPSPDGADIHSVDLVRADGSIWRVDSISNSLLKVNVNDTPAHRSLYSFRHFTLREDGSVGFVPDQINKPAHRFDGRFVDVQSGNTALIGLRASGQVEILVHPDIDAIDSRVTNLVERTPTNLTDFTAVSFGDFDAIALRLDGSLVRWDGYDNKRRVPNTDLPIKQAIVAAQRVVTLNQNGTIDFWVESGMPAKVESALVGDINDGVALIKDSIRGKRIGIQRVGNHWVILSFENGEWKRHEEVSAKLAGSVFCAVGDGYALGIQPPSPKGDASKLAADRAKLDSAAPNQPIFPLKLAHPPGKPVFIQVDPNLPTTIGLPILPPEFDDVVHVSPSFQNGELDLLLVREDGSSWNCWAGKVPELRPQQNLAYFVKKGDGIRLYRDGTIDSLPLKNSTLDESLFTGAHRFKAVAGLSSCYAGLDVAGRIHWLAKPIDLGNRSPEIFNSPAGDGFEQISIGYNQGLAINRDKKLFAWGSGNLAEVPKKLQSLNFKAVAASRKTSLAIDEHGRVHAWGTSFSERNPTVVDALAPVFDAETCFSYVGGPHTLAIRRIDQNWLVLQQDDAGDWNVNTEAGDALKGCYFAHRTSVGNLWIGIRAIEEEAP